MRGGKHREEEKLETSGRRCQMVRYLDQQSVGRPSEEGPFDLGRPLICCCWKNELANETVVFCRHRHLRGACVHSLLTTLTDMPIVDKRPNFVAAVPLICFRAQSNNRDLPSLLVVYPKRMSETLVAILLVTSSAKGSALVYRWPPHPRATPRLARPRPIHDVVCSHADNPWRAANMTDDTPEPSLRCSTHYEDTEEDDYLWRPTNDRRDRSLSYSHSRSHPTSRRASPSRDHKESYPIEGSKEPIPHNDQYTQVLGYSAEFLAGMLCPQRAMCHQKFELVVDDLAFIGHPVCSESDCVWRFKQEKVKMIPRGRGSKKGQTPQMEEKSLTPEKPAPETPSKEPKPSGTAPENPWLQTFHLVLVLDLPDPSSSASGKITKYLDTIYEQIAFTVTAVLFHEQVKHNFVETECDALGSLESDYISKGEPLAYSFPRHSFTDDLQESRSESSCPKLSTFPPSPSP